VAYVVLTLFISLLQDTTRILYIRYGFVKNLPETISKEDLEKRIRQYAVRTNGWLLIFVLIAYFSPMAGIYTYFILPIVTF
ncbi:hypothetical protein ABXW34_21700, partial [Streptococcus suis]